MGDLGEQPLTSEIYPLEWYRETPLGPLPEEWKTVQIEDIAEVKGGKRLPKGHKFSDQPTPYPYIRVVDFKNNSIDLSNLRFLHSEDRKAIQRYTISCKDLYISIAGTIGLVGLVPQKIDGANLTENAAKIVIKDEKRVDQRYLVYFLASHIGQTEISQRTTKTSQPKLALTRIKQIPVILPPLLEQQGIAHVLRTVQKALETTEQVIAASRELKRSLMNHLFTYGPVSVDEAEQVTLKKTVIGLMPANWGLTRIDDLFDWQLGKMLSPAAKRGICPRPYLRNLNVQWGKVTVHDLVEMDFTEKEQAKFELKNGDILVCEGGEVGRTALWRNEISECYFQKAIHRLRPKDGRIRPEIFLYHMMNAFLIRQSYGVVGTDTTIAHLPGMKLKALEVPLPPKDEQDQIVRVLEGMEEKISAEENRQSALAALFKTLLHNLMTGKIRVNDLDLSVVKAMV